MHMIFRPTFLITKKVCRYFLNKLINYFAYIFHLLLIVLDLKVATHLQKQFNMQNSYKLLVKNAKQLVMITKNHEKMLCGKAMNDIAVINDAYWI